MVYPPVVCTVEFMGQSYFEAILGNNSSGNYEITKVEIINYQNLNNFFGSILEENFGKTHRSSLASNDRNNGHSSVRKFEKKRRRKGKGADIDRSNETNHRRGDRRIDSFEDFVSLPV